MMRGAGLVWRGEAGYGQRGVDWRLRKAEGDKVMKEGNGLRGGEKVELDIFVCRERRICCHFVATFKAFFSRFSPATNRGSTAFLQAMHPHVGWLDG